MIEAVYLLAVQNNITNPLYPRIDHHVSVPLSGVVKVKAAEQKSKQKAQSSLAGKRKEKSDLRRVRIFSFTVKVQPESESEVIRPRIYFKIHECLSVKDEIWGTFKRW